MYKLQRLSERTIIKRKFDPAKKRDREIAYKFFNTLTWRGLTESNSCPFFCEWPYVEIPAMLKAKLVEYYATRETPE